MYGIFNLHLKFTIKINHSCRVNIPYTIHGSCWDIEGNYVFFVIHEEMELRIFGSEDLEASQLQNNVLRDVIQWRPSGLADAVFWGDLWRQKT